MSLPSFFKKFMPKKPTSKRLRFFLGHLLISVIIACLIVFVVYGVWYPSPLADALQVSQMFLMVVVIDMIIGPLLGFIIYKEGKKTLKMDLAVIILLQALATSYGVYSIAQARPVWFVHHGILFTLVNHVDADYTQAVAPYNKSSWTGPRYVAYQNTESADGDIYNAANYGAFVGENMRVLPLGMLESFNDKSAIDAELAKYPTATGWTGLAVGDGGMTMLIDGSNNQIVAIVPLHPWN